MGAAGVHFKRISGAVQAPYLVLFGEPFQAHSRCGSSVDFPSFRRRFGTVVGPFGAAKCAAAGDIRLAFPPDSVLGVVCRLKRH